MVYQVSIVFIIFPTHSSMHGVHCNKLYVFLPFHQLSNKESTHYLKNTSKNFTYLFAVFSPQIFFESSLKDRFLSNYVCYVGPLIFNFHKPFWWNVSHSSSVLFLPPPSRVPLFPFLYHPLPHYTCTKTITFNIYQSLPLDFSCSLYSFISLSLHRSAINTGAEETLPWLVSTKSSTLTAFRHS